MAKQSAARKSRKKIDNDHSDEQNLTPPQQHQNNHDLLSESSKINESVGISDSEYDEDNVEDDEVSNRPQDVQDFFDIYADASNDVESSAFTQSDAETEQIDGEENLSNYQDIPSKRGVRRKASENLVAHKKISKIQDMMEFQNPLPEDIDDEDDNALVSSEANLNADILKQSLIPTVKDSSLWILKCKPGDELHISNLLFNKFMALKNSPKPLKIKSVVYRPNFAGFIYIEAHHQGAVKEAIDGISSLKSYEYREIMTVPVKEMPSVLRIVQDSSVNLKVMDFVRIKRGIYKDDLAQVLYVDHSQNKAQIQIVPRFKSENHFSKTLPKTSAENADKNDANNLTEKSKTEPSGKQPITYVQRMFNKNAVDEADLHEDEGFLFYGGNQYSQAGHLIKMFPIVALQVTNVEPSLDELANFQMDNPTAIIQLNQTNSKNHFAVHDNVCVVSGELVNLQGKIVKINKSVISVLPSHEDINVTIDFVEAELSKTFSIGDHVKVLASKHINETGLVVASDEKNATILTDTNIRELQIPVNFLQLSKMKYSGVDQTGQYSYGDLVLLDERNAGIIIQIEKDSFKILNIYGKNMTITRNDIVKKLVKTDTMTFDSHRGTIKKKCSVQAVNGPLEGQEGRVIGVFRNFVYVKSKNFLENGGIFVTRGSNLKLSSSNIEYSNMAPNIMHHSLLHSPKTLTSPGHSSLLAQQSQDLLAKSSGASSARSLSRYPTGSLRNNRQLIGKTVKITQGPYKTYSGIVKATTDTIASVELTAEYKTINVDLSRISPVEPKGKPNMAGNTSAYWHTPYAMANTTSYAMNTPHAGGLHATPMYDGSRTPGFGNQTPAHQTPNHSPSNIEEHSPFSPNAISPSFPSSVESLNDDISSLKDSSLYHLSDKSLSTASPGFIPITSVNSEVPSPAAISPSLLDLSYNYNLSINSDESASLASMTPSIEGSSDTSNVNLENNVDWISVGLMVLFREHCSDKSLVGKSGTVRSINGSNVSVFVSELQKVTTVSGYHLKPKPGFLGDKVKIIFGLHCNKIASIINDTNDLLLVDVDGQYKMVNNTHVCKLDQNEANFSSFSNKNTPSNHSPTPSSPISQ
ncbi:MAG: Transcription elongation factor SPT5 [Marteilia pararefringens]